MSLPEIAGHELLDLIGAGRCGAVYRATAAGNQVCALKVFSSMAIHRKALATSLQALQLMPPHRSILVPWECHFEGSPYYIASPLIGTLAKDGQGRRQWLTPTLESMCYGGLGPEKAWGYIYQLADAVAWLHKFGLAHGNLRPCNILLEDDTEAGIRITDLAQGWVGGIHHLDLTDHFVHLCPEQAEQPDGVFTGYGPSWDAYAFGVIAYRLISGKLPRGAAAWAEQKRLEQERAAAGLAYQIDSRSLLQAVRAQPKIQWDEPPHSKWDERRRSIIERALDLNPAARWTDVREMVREFEILESDYLLEEAREQTVQERQLQVQKVRRLQLGIGALAAGFVATSFYALFTLSRARQAEELVAQKDSVLEKEKQQQESEIRGITAQRDSVQQQKQTADANLKYAQKAVDQFLTQLLQTPTNNALDVEFSQAQLKEALQFCLTTLPNLEADPKLGMERVRAYGNIGQIHLRLREHGPAMEFLAKARDQAAKLLQSSSTEPLPAQQMALYQQWFGRYSLLLSDLYDRRGERVESLTQLKNATPALSAGLAADPQNRLARQECARAWMEFGRRSLQSGEIADAEKAQNKVAETLTPEALGGADLQPEESFILARAKFTQGQALREAGQVKEALEVLIEAVTQMGELVSHASPRNQEQALMLAAAYTELAELIGKNFGAKEAREAHQQAIPILLELNRLLPEWSEVKYLLARNDSDLALLDRDEGKSSEAAKRKQNAMELLNEILADEKDNTRYAALLAKTRGEYAEIMSDMGKSNAALPIVKQAVAAMEVLLQKQVSTDLSPERRAWEIQLAQMYGVLGHTSQTMSQVAEAKVAYQRAAEQWQKLALVLPADESVRNGLSWSKERLAKLK
jgi:eukaryotic-like serine/threonine-protein kinase